MKTIYQLQLEVIQAAREYYTAQELWMDACNRGDGKLTDADTNAALTAVNLHDALKALDAAEKAKVASNAKDQARKEAESKAGIRRCSDCGGTISKSGECHCN